MWPFKCRCNCKEEIKQEDAEHSPRIIKYNSSDGLPLLEQEKEQCTKTPGQLLRKAQANKLRKTPEHIKLVKKTERQLLVDWLEIANYCAKNGMTRMTVNSFYEPGINMAIVRFLKKKGFCFFESSARPMYVNLNRQVDYYIIFSLTRRYLGISWSKNEKV
jgi:hypothetical protein